MSLKPCVFIVDDDDAVRDSLGQVMEVAGLEYQAFESAEQFLQVYSRGQPGCLLLDLNMPEMSGDELQAELIRQNIRLPIIFLSAFGDIPTTVRAIKSGAVDFLTKPVSSKLLVEQIQMVLQQQANSQELELDTRLSSLTTRELDVMSQVLAGQSSKAIARQFGISHRTVEIHRARVMEKTGAANLLELARIYEASQLPTKPAG